MAGCEQIYVDKTSGKFARRPTLDEVLRMLRAGDQLVVTKLDRLGRSLEHLIELSKQLQAGGVDLVVLDQGIDTSTAVGRMFRLVSPGPTMNAPAWLASSPRGDAAQALETHSARVAARHGARHSAA